MQDDVLIHYREFTLLGYHIGMHKITISLPIKERSYQLIIGTGLIDRVPKVHDLSPYSKIVVVTDRNLEKLWVTRLLDSLPVKGFEEVNVVALQPGEDAKNTANLREIWDIMHDAGCDRHSLVIALGGGVIGDIAGFAAATYMRGVACLHMPTTVLSMVDSSLGGKTAVNYRYVKNLVGTFTQPTAVISDVELLSSLPKREFVSGFGEIIKHGLIQDVDYLRLVVRKKPLEFSTDELEQIIAGSVRIKAAVVQADETESGLRKALNFGHTIGHAIEALSLSTTNPLLHGEAISIGMVIEADIAHQQGLLGDQDVTAIKQFMINAGLPVISPAFETSDILTKLQSDKKNAHGTVRFTLLKALGEAIWNQEVPEDVIVSALQHHMETN